MLTGCAPVRFAFSGRALQRSMDFILAVFVAASLAGAALDAKETSLAGTWTLSIERIAVKLVLEQHKGALTGTLDWPHG